MSTCKPYIGMPATIIYYSDRSPATIIDVSLDGKKIFIQEDTAVRFSHPIPSDIQDYTYTPNPNGQIYKASLRKDGTYRIVNSKTIISLGARRKYYDYSF